MRARVFASFAIVAAWTPAASTLAQDVDRSVSGAVLRTVDPGDLKIRPIYVRNGDLDYGSLNGEFLLWKREISFYRASEVPSAPDTFHWSEIDGPIESARWELCRRESRRGQTEPVCSKIAEGTISNPPQQDTNGDHELNFELEDHIPEYNEGSGNVVYEIRVFSTQPDTTSERITNSVVMTHLPRANDPGPLQPDFPDGPYDCDALPSMTRDFNVWIPRMQVLATTETGNNDRDEVYFLYQRLGPGSQDTGRVRLPQWPDNDGYYEAHDDIYSNAPSSFERDWSNPDGETVANPGFGIVRLAHNEAVRIDVVVQEQDNKDLKALRDFTIGVHTVISVIGHAVGDFWGHMVGATADVIIAGNKTFVEPINEDDLLAIFQVTAINKCGYLQVAYSAPMSGSAPSISESINQQFVDGGVKSDPSVSTNVSVRTAVLKGAANYNNAWTSGDFIAGADPGNPPQVIEPGYLFQAVLDAHGTADSHYRFTLRSTATKPNR